MRLPGNTTADDVATLERALARVERQALLLAEQLAAHIRATVAFQHGTSENVMLLANAVEALKTRIEMLEARQGGGLH